MADRDLEFLGSNFALEIDGAAIAFFTGCSGLSATTEVVEEKVVDATGKLIVRKRPGRTNYEDIVLKRGASADKTLTDWHKTVIDGAVERKNGSVVLYDDVLTELGRWNFEAGWISKWSGGELSADSDDVMVEEVTITHELLTRVK
jgi:phage tail-like protein